MIYEFPINISKKPYKVFLYDTFHCSEAIHSPLHNHFNCEVHVVIEGNISFLIEKEMLNLSCGDAVVLPSPIALAASAESVIVF